MEPGLQDTEDNVRLSVPEKLQRSFGLLDCEIGSYLSKLHLDFQVGNKDPAYACVLPVENIFIYL